MRSRCEVWSEENAVLDAGALLNASQRNSAELTAESVAPANAEPITFGCPRQQALGGGVAISLATGAPEATEEVDPERVERVRSDLFADLEIVRSAERDRH
jgi:hypothetical protein